MIKPKGKFIFLIHGVTGAGKSTVAKKLGSIIERTATFDMDDIKWQISDFKKGKEDNNLIRNIIFKMVEGYCENSINCIIPQALVPGDYERYEAISKKYNYKLYVVDLFGKEGVLVERIKKRQQESNKPNPSSTERILKNIEYYKNTELNHIFENRIDTTSLTPEKLESLLIDLLDLKK